MHIFKHVNVSFRKLFVNVNQIYKVDSEDPYSVIVLLNLTRNHVPGITIKSRRIFVLCLSPFPLDKYFFNSKCWELGIYGVNFNCCRLLSACSVIMITTFQKHTENRKNRHVYNCLPYQSTWVDSAFYGVRVA